jgi:hypothetical protein
MSVLEVYMVNFNTFDFIYCLGCKESNELLSQMFGKFYLTLNENINKITQ